MNAKATSRNLRNRKDIAAHIADTSRYCPLTRIERQQVRFIVLHASNNPRLGYQQMQERGA